MRNPLINEPETRILKSRSIRTAGERVARDLASKVSNGLVPVLDLRDETLTILRLLLELGAESVYLSVCGCVWERGGWM